jgi:pyruvate/2-oxoglutarate dehydrogenase complex dihydrolipoamide dehydrogenase (E3) component
VARTDYDLVIIGAGAAGLIAARFAVQLGARVAGRARSHWWRLHVDRLRAEQVADSSGEGGSRDSNRPALGATPVMPDIPGLKERPHCTHHNIFDLSHLPASLTVVGGGPLGMELAQALSVDHQLRTNVPHIYAAGDVLGREQFSHVAGWQAFEATRNALLPGTASGRVNPMAWVTFTDPEVAQVGLSEKAAREQLGETMSVTRWDIARVDRARCDDDEDGFIKLVSNRQGVLIGATIVASRAGELSGEMSLAIGKGLSLGDVATAVHAYPTYATALQQMTSQAATARWTSSAAGRLVARLMGFARRPAWVAIAYLVSAIVFRQLQNRPFPER